MDRNDIRYKNYVAILKEELVPAMGCTEPIAIAYAAAKAADILGVKAEKADIKVSGNIIKNAKSVVVPGTDGGKGVPTAAAAGIVIAAPEKQLEVLVGITPEQKSEIIKWISSGNIAVSAADAKSLLYIDITLTGGGHSSRVVVADTHTNIVHTEKDGEVLFDKEYGIEVPPAIDRSCLNIKDIVDFANSVEISDIEECVGRQISFNTAISKEGLKNSWGSNIGTIITGYLGSDVNIRARAAAAAGSDARMNGCELPVIIVSGSGNQGMTASLPVITFAEELNVGREKMLRAVALSDLVTIHQKTGIGRLSAFCGAVSAGCGAGAGIAYLHGEGAEGISHTVANTLGIIVGTVCDGAKASCAAKISAAVDAALMGYNMYKTGNNFKGADGIIDSDVEDTIANVGRMAREGMKETDKVILDIMIHTK